VPISQIGRRDKVESAEISRNNRPPESPGGDTSPEAPSPEPTFENNSATNSSSHTMQRVPYAPYPSSSSASSASSSSSTLPASYIPYSQFASGKNFSYTEPEPASITANGGMDDDFDFDAACMLALEKAEKDHVEKKMNKREITMDAENADDGGMSQATQAQFMSQETLYHSQKVEGHSQGEGEGEGEEDDGMVEGHSQGEGEGDDGMVEGHSQGEVEGEEDDGMVEDHSQGEGEGEEDDGMVEGHSQGEGEGEGDDGMVEGHSQGEGDDGMVEGHGQGEGEGEGDDGMVEGHSQGEVEGEGDDGMVESSILPVAVDSPVLTAPDCVQDSENIVDRHEGSFENNSATNSSSHTMQRVPYAPYPSSSSASSASSSSSTLPASYIPYSQFASGKNFSYTEPEPASITANGGMDDDFDFDAACMLALEKAEKDHVEKKMNKREITMDAENADDGDMSQSTQAQFMSQETLYHSQKVEGHSQGEGEGEGEEDDGMVEGHSQGEGEGEVDDGMVEGHSQGEGEGEGKGEEDDGMVEGHSQGEGDDGMVEGHSQGEGEGEGEGDDGMVEGHSQEEGEGEGEEDDGMVEGHSKGEGEGEEDDGMVEGHSQGEGEGEEEGDDGMVEGHSQGEVEGDLVEGGNLQDAVHSPVLTAPDCVEDSENIVDRHEETVDPVHQSELTEYFNEDNDSAAKGEEAVDQVRKSPLHHQGENENEGQSYICGGDEGTQVTQSGDAAEGVVDERIPSPAHTQDAENTLNDTGDSTQLDPHTHNAHTSDE
jgi:hypothetical protein